MKIKKNTVSIQAPSDETLHQATLVFQGNQISHVIKFSDFHDLNAFASKVDGAFESNSQSMEISFKNTTYCLTKNECDDITSLIEEWYDYASIHGPIPTLPFERLGYPCASIKRYGVLGDLTQTTMTIRGSVTYIIQLHNIQEMIEVHQMLKSQFEKSSQHPYHLRFREFQYPYQLLFRGSEYCLSKEMTGDSYLVIDDWLDEEIEMNKGEFTPGDHSDLSNLYSYLDRKNYDLHEAALRLDNKAVRNLLSIGADPNKIYYSGFNALGSMLLEWHEITGTFYNMTCKHDESINVNMGICDKCLYLERKKAINFRKIIRMSKLLIENGADPFLMGPQGYCAFDIIIDFFGTSDIYDYVDQDQADSYISSNFS